MAVMLRQSQAAAFLRLDSGRFSVCTKLVAWFASFFVLMPHCQVWLRSPSPLLLLPEKLSECSSKSYCWLLLDAQVNSYKDSIYTNSEHKKPICCAWKWTMNTVEATDRLKYFSTIVALPDCPLTYFHSNPYLYLKIFLIIYSMVFIRSG